MTHIDFEAKTDRELLILVAQKCNETTDHLARLNDSVARHEKAINKFNSQAQCDSWSSLRIIRDNWQLSAGALTLLCGVIFAVGRLAGWW